MADTKPDIVHCYQLRDSITGLIADIDPDKITVQQYRTLIEVKRQLTNVWGEQQEGK